MTCAGAGPEVSPEGFREAARRGWGSSLEVPEVSAEVARQPPGVGRATCPQSCWLLTSNLCYLLQPHCYNFYPDLERRAGSSRYKGGKSRTGARNRGNLKH